MARLLPFSAGLGLVLVLSACGGDSCESVQNEIAGIGREIQADPELALDEETGRELEALRDKLIEMGCLQDGPS